jgi:SAM-dependent methyltransferase
MSAIEQILKGMMGSNYTVGELIYNADFYDGMNTNLTDLQFYKRWLPNNKDARILELCCGTGRLTIPIAKDGYNITGVDYTRSMLEQAKSKASAQGLNIELIEADIRTLDLPEKYDLIFIPFNSIHHLYRNDDLFDAFKAAKNHLKHDGVFLFDCFNPNIQFIVEGEKELKEIARYLTNDGKSVTIKQIMQYESSTQINRIQWHHFIDGDFDSIQNLDMRMFFPQELNTYLQSNGFSIIHKFGNFEEHTFTNESDKQIFVCKKAFSIHS